MPKCYTHAGLRIAVVMLPSMMAIAALCAVAQPGQKATTGTSTQAPKMAPKQAASPANDGSRIFQQQCSRCHATPESFSPRISGTILRHMRVRASLSQHEEEQLLRFFNP